MKNPKYQTQLIILGLNQEYMKFFQNTCLSTLMQMMNKLTLEYLSPDMLNDLMEQVT